MLEEKSSEGAKNKLEEDIKDKLEKKMKKRSVVEIIENIATLILALWGISMFWLWIFWLLPSEVSLRNMILALGLITLIILKKLYRKYKDKAILVIMVIIALVLIGRFFGVGA